MEVMNKEFLRAIFGDEFVWAHVTDFFYDPEAIPKDEFGMAWAGNYYVNQKLRSRTNQYFTVSLFNTDHRNAKHQHPRPRRRKDLFRACYCIVIDDVIEKISLDRVVDMPAPSWALETSPGSLQWGYILDEPCKDRAKIEALLAGLIDNLTDDSIDPGMAGVTRYVRLPEGYNTKASKIKSNGGAPHINLNASFI